jgi:dCMP deaminase
MQDKYADTDSVRASKRMFDAAGVLYRPYAISDKKIVLDL